MSFQQLLFIIGYFGIAAVVLRFTLWRALLVFRPTSVRLEIEEPADQVKLPDALQKPAAELERLGFVRLGSHSEKPPFGPRTLCFDFARAEEGIFATLFEGRDEVAALYLMSRLPGGGFVISANHRRPAKDEPGRYVTGWLEDVSVDRIYKAHLRRTEGLPVQADFTQEGRMAAARAWYEGPGKSEVRQQHVPGLLWTVASLGMVAAAVFGRR